MSFKPFDDNQTLVRAPAPTRDGMDTSGFDIYRQGIEISRNKFRFLGTQPKMWAGEISGEISIATYGQSLGSIEENVFGFESKFLDIPNFNPVAYITLGTDYPLPIIFNQGPEQQNEAIIEPLTIPFRKHTNEGPFYAHSCRGSLEDGNDLDNFITKASSQIESFIELILPTETRYFLDEGGGYFGNIIQQGYISDVERVFIPFDDTISFSPEMQLHTTIPAILDRIKSGLTQGAQTMLPYGKKSASAGWTHYGLNIGQYGTDSMAYSGLSRGS